MPAAPARNAAARRRTTRRRPPAAVPARRGRPGALQARRPPPARQPERTRLPAWLPGLACAVAGYARPGLILARGPPAVGPAVAAEPPPSGWVTSGRRSRGLGPGEPGLSAPGGAPRPPKPWW